MFCFFRNENNLSFNFLNSKLHFVSFGFRYFLVVFERICFYFHFDHSDVRIKQIFLFQYRNELKTRSQKQISFMHIDLTNYDSVTILILSCIKDIVIGKSVLRIRN
jgi:hypothetical protein